MGIQYLVRECRDSSATVLAAKNGRGGDDHNTLSVCIGQLQGTLYSELDLEVLCRGPLGRYQCSGGCGTNGAIFRLLLDLLHKGYEGEEVCIACIIYRWYDFAQR